MSDSQKENISNSKSKTISINIQGQNFFLSCRKEKQDLLIRAGQRVDSEMKLVQNVVGRGIDRIAITAAINLALKLEQLEKSIAQGQSLPIDDIYKQIKNLNDLIENELSNTEINSCESGNEE